MLEISFLQDTEFDVKSLFVQDHAKATYLALYFPGLRHLLFRRIQPKPISPELLESSPAPRCLATLVLDGVVGTVPDLRDLIRLFRSPMLRRVHVLRPMDRTIQDTDMNHSSHEHPMLPEAARVLALNPNQSMYDIFDELLQSQYRYHHDNSSSSQAPPLLPPPYASLCLEFRDEGAYLRSFDQDRVGAGPTYDLSTNHSVLRDLLAEERLANYLESDQCRHLYELYMPSTAFDVKPFINSFSSHVMLRESGTKNVQGQQGSSSTGPLADAQPTTMSSSLLQRPVQHQWQCRNLQRLTLSFLTSSNAESINVQSYRELFGFLSFNCPQIQELDLQTQGMLLTWDSGLCLTSRWRHLRHLVLRGCSLGCESLATAVALRKRYRKPGYIGSRESKDLEWVAKQPRKLHVQHRRTSRAMCREVLCLPPFSKMQQRHQQLYGAMSQSSTETDLMCMDYGSHVHLGHDRHTYEPGSLAAALESTLELQPRHRQRKQRLETIDDLDIFSHKNLDMLDLSMLDLKEGALWESLQSVHFVTENLTHTIARRPKSIWDDFIQSWRDLLPGTEVKFAFGQDTPELQRFN
ncbi:hypothetical protein BGZ73_009119 [Actinomortierella ambigua]|nr:hypothetical protein BGZ73_009119 [Actinomortierella ambigua]